MSDELTIRLENDIVAAMKNKKPEKVKVLRLLKSRAMAVAKNDSSRQMDSNDIVSAAMKMIKESNETIELLTERNTQAPEAEYEIEIVSQYLPQALTHDELVNKITKLKAEAPNEKGALGYVMKNLNTNYKGSFDPRTAQEIFKNLG